jgi:hypothetical protein
MVKYSFTGDWEFKMPLESFSEVFTFDWIDSTYRKRELIDIKILDVHNENPVPEPEQLNAINYLIFNQEKVIQEIFRALTFKIIPYFKSILGEDSDIFIPLNKETDMANILGIGSVLIFNRFKNDCTYVMLYFNSFRYDKEHGLNLVFYKDRFIGTHEDFKEAYEDMGLDYKEILREMSLKNQRQHENKDYRFHETKSNQYSIKPWQQHENRIYPFRLLQTDQQDKFIDFMESKGLQLNYDKSSLMEIAENRGFEKALEFLRNK